MPGVGAAAAKVEGEVAEDLDKQEADLQAAIKRQNDQLQEARVELEQVEAKRRRIAKTKEELEKQAQEQEEKARLEKEQADRDAAAPSAMQQG